MAVADQPGVVLKLLVTCVHNEWSTHSLAQVTSVAHLSILSCTRHVLHFAMCSRCYFGFIVCGVMIDIIRMLEGSKQLGRR